MNKKFKQIKIVTSIFCITLAILWSAATIASKTVLVGGYIFPPFIEQNKDGLSGITLDLIALMNSSQKEYKFKFVFTSPKRRYIHFEKKAFDMIIFEDIKWGWDNKKVDISRVFLMGGEVYITGASANKNQSYFDDFTNKSIRGFLGYHYGFANFNDDVNYLKTKHNCIVTTDHERNIISVINNRSDIAVLTKSYLEKYLSKNPKAKDKILISTKYDQVYNHTILIRNNIKPTISEINALLNDIKRNGSLDKLWKKYGL